MAPVLESPYNQSYAVIIGINAYEKLPSLEYAVKDARAMEEKLKSLGFQTTTLLNQYATRDKIVKILGDELPQKVQNNDRVIVFFAGHTQTEEKADGTHMGYLVPVDADTKNIINTAISMDQIRGFSRRLQAKHVLYLIDSAFAGLGLTKSGTIPPSDREYLQKVSTRRAHQILTAGGKGELVHLEQGGLGVFTEYVLEALDGSADRDGKGFITFSDIASYVKPKVSRFTGTKQVPQYGNIDGEGEFVFVLAGLSAAPKAATPGLVAPQAPIDEEKRLAEEQARLRKEKEELRETNQRSPARGGRTKRNRQKRYDHGHGDATFCSRIGRFRPGWQVYRLWRRDCPRYEDKPHVGGKGQRGKYQLAGCQELLRELSRGRLYGLADADAGRAGGTV